MIHYGISDIPQTDTLVFKPVKELFLFTSGKYRTEPSEPCIERSEGVKSDLLKVMFDPRK